MSKKVQNNKNNVMLQKDSKSLDINKPIIIGIGGPNFSGYEILKEGILKKVGSNLVNYISMDNFLLNKNTQDELQLVDEYEFDQESPESQDFKLIVKCFEHWNNQMKIPFNVPVQHRGQGRRISSTKLDWKPVIVLQGPLALYDKNVRSFLDLSVYTDLDNDICLFNMVENIVKSEDLRNSTTEGINLVEKVIKYQLRYIKANVETNITKTKEFASLILPNVQDDHNHFALDLIIGLLKDDAVLLQERYKRDNFQIMTQVNAKISQRKASKDILNLVNQIDSRMEYEKEKEEEDKLSQNMEVQDEKDKNIEGNFRQDDIKISEADKNKIINDKDNNKDNNNVSSRK